MTGEASQWRLLTRHFAGRFLDNDLVAPGSDQHAMLARTAAMAMVPGLLVPASLLFKYSYPFKTFEALERVSWGDKSFFIALAMAVMGLVTVLEWDVLHVDRRDCMALGVLPVKPRTLLAAKASALALLFLGLAVPVTGLGAVTYPLVLYIRWPVGGLEILRAIGAHGAASMAACGFMFFGLLAIHGVLASLLPPRAFARVSVWVQMACTFALVIVILLLPLMAGSVYAIKDHPSGVLGYLPHGWFVGMGQWLAGHGDEAWGRLATRGWAALGLVTVVALVTNLLGFERRVRRMLEGAGPGVEPSRGLRKAGRLGWLVAPAAISRGFYEFTRATFWRASSHRIIVAAFLGAAAAVGGVAWMTARRGTVATWGTPSPRDVLAIELLTVAVGVVGVRVAAATPAELKAGWVLRLLDTGQAGRWFDGFRAATIVTGVVPLCGLVAAGSAWAFGWRTAAVHAVACALWAGLVFECLFVEFARVPFACAARGTGGGVQARWFVMAACFGMVFTPLAWLVTIASASAAWLAVLAGLGAAVVLGVRTVVRRTMPGEPGSAFVTDDDGTQTMGLS